MKKQILLTLLLGAALSYAQSPQIPLTGNVGAGGSFPVINSPGVVFASDANHTMAFPEMSGSSGVIVVTSSVSLTAARNLIVPLTSGFNWQIQNATTGGQSIVVIGASGTGVAIPNGATANVHTDGTNVSSITATSSLSVTGDGSGHGAFWDATEGTAPFSPLAGHDRFYADLVSHCFQYSANGASFTCLGSGGGVSPLTTKGDLYGFGTANARFPVGADGLVVTADSTQPLGLKWKPAILGPLQVPNPFTAFLRAADAGPFSAQATNIFAQSCNNLFTDGTPYCTAGPAYTGFGEFIDDFMLGCMSNPSACTAALLDNTLSKWDSKFSNSMGYPIALLPDLTQPGEFCSGFDLSCSAGNGTATGDGRIMFPAALYLYCQKEGIGSSACNTRYNAYVAHIKAAWALVPRDGTTHLFTVPTGPGTGAASEFVCGTAFMEYMRNTGAVANCNVWYAIDMADMQALANGAGDSTNAAFFAGELANVVTGIRGNLVDGATGLLIAATLQNASNDDIPSSALAVACDVMTDIFAPCGILTSGQKTTIETYFDTNYSTLTNSAGFVLQTQKVGGWTTIGKIPSTGGPPYTGAGFTATQYQGGLWTFHAGWFDVALGQIDPAKVVTQMTSYLNGVDPGCEYFNQGSSTCNGTAPNLESPAFAASVPRYFPIGPTYTPGLGCVNKYGTLIDSAGLANGTGCYSLSVQPQGGVVIGQNPNSGSFYGPGNSYQFWPNANVSHVMDRTNNTLFSNFLFATGGVLSGGFDFGEVPGDSDFHAAYRVSGVDHDWFSCAVSGGHFCTFGVISVLNGGSLPNTEVLDLANANAAGASAMNFVSLLSGHNSTMGYANSSYTLFPWLAGKTYIAADNNHICLAANAAGRAVCDFDIDPTTGVSTHTGIIDSSLTAGTASICPNGTGGRFTNSGCTGSSPWSEHDWNPASPTQALDTSASLNVLVLFANNAFTIAAGTNGQHMGVAFCNSGGPWTVTPPANVYGMPTTFQPPSSNCEMFDLVYSNISSQWQATGMAPFLFGTDGYLAGSGICTAGNGRCYSLGGTLSCSNVAMQSAAGTGASCNAVNGLDGTHEITITIGTSPGVSGPLAIVTFTASRGHVSSCVVGPQFSEYTSIGQIPYITFGSATSYTLTANTTALTASTNYHFNVVCP